MVYTSVFNCLYRCYHIPVSRSDLDSVPQRENDHKRGVMICEGCNSCVQGLYINIGKDSCFHPECFSCTICGQMIGHSEQYSKCSDTLLCGKCCQKMAPTPTKKDINSTRKFSNSQVIDISVPRSYFNGLEFNLYDTVKRKFLHSIQSNEDEMTTELYIKKVPSNLNSGVFQIETDDRILEVEGVLVVNQSIDELQEIFGNVNTKMVSIVIERKLPGQAMTPNFPLDKTSEAFGCKEQIQGHLDVTRKNAFINTNKHAQLTIASGYKSQSRLKQTTTTTTTTTTQSPPPIMEVSSEHTDSESSDDHPFEFSAPDDEMNDLTEKIGDVILSEPNIEEKLESRSLVTTGRHIRRASREGVLFRPEDLIRGNSLGNGFFGQVYLVTDSITGNKYAMKQLTRGDSSSFKKELTILKSLSHPNILRFVGVFSEKGCLSLITEFLDGGTLYSAICKLEIFPWIDRVRIARDISAGMDYLHEHNIVHRDLNSHNVLLRKDLTAVVADFGLARTVEGETLKPVNSVRYKTNRNSNTSTKPITMGVKMIKRKMTIVGSMAWMAPEMMKDKLYNEMVDVYSFGIILCELLSRLNADPDFIPRNKEYIVDWENFVPKIQLNSPSQLIGLAQHATQEDSDYRPPFEVCRSALRHLLSLLEEDTIVKSDHECLTLIY